MFRIPSLIRGRRGYEEGEEWRARWEDVMGRRGISDYYHHSTHSSHRNDVISEVHVSGSHVDRLVSHQLKVGSCVTKSVECFK